ncbi:MAG: divalent-cation tolerance protein CutA [Rickettsiales endosymbiont of Dermacentor nuttalli]
MSCAIIYVTFQNKEYATAIAKILVTEKIVACANIIDKMTSIYLWNDKLEENVEVLMIAKTTKVQIENAILRIKQLHKYECPCIVTLDITGGNVGYINWIKNSVYLNIKVE